MESTQSDGRRFSRLRCVYYNARHNGILGNTNIGDAGVKHLTGLRNLSSMHLPETRITSGCLADIGKLKKLGVLTLANNNFSGGYGALASCEMLAWIELSGIQISDQDVKENARRT